MSKEVINKKQYLFSLGMLGALFFIFGLVSWVNSILVPYFKVACELRSEVQGYLANFAFYIAYLVMTIPASIMLNKTGLKRGVEYGLWILAAGALLFIPAALLREYNMFLVGLFTMGTALAILQTASNPFVTIIGPMESAARRISVMGICNKLAGILAPLVFAKAVIRPSDKQVIDQVNAGLLTGIAKEEALDNMILSVIPPYLILGVFLFVFGIIFYKSSIPEINPNKENESVDSDGKDKKSILAYPYLILGAIALFLHVGSQAVSVNTIMGYAQSMGMDILAAKIFPSMTLGCILLGYLIGVFVIPKYISQQQALVICTVTGLILSTLVVLTHGTVHLFGVDTDISIWFLVLLGIPNSLIYAGIWPLAIRNLGRFTSLGSSIVVMGLCGNAIIPMVYAWMADSTNSLQKGYWILPVCFALMIAYAVYGYKIENWRKVRNEK